MSIIANSEPWKLKRIKGRHKLMIDYHLAGLSNVQIASELECTPQSVSMILNSPIVEAEVARRRSSQDRKVDEAAANVVSRVKEILNRNAENAAEKLVEQIDHEDPRVAQSAACRILDEVYGKGGNGPQTVVMISTEQFNLMSNTLVECRKE